VIGGGDTGSDCVGTSNRQGAKKVVQIELLPKPVEHSDPWNPAWPDWPGILRTSSSHLEGCERLWNIATAELAGNGRVERALVDVVEWLPPDTPGGRPRMQVKEGSRFTIEADLVLLAMGFVHVEHGPLVTELGIELDERGNVKTGSYGETSVPGIFAAGDTRLGASLVVRAIATGRKAAIACDRYLMGETSLPDTTLM
jgi:glutamate synthase (NADPH/NADH) small chain